VRELGNVIERAVVLAGTDTIEPEDLALEPVSANDSVNDTLMFLPFHQSVEQFKRKRLQEAIIQSGGSKTKAAQALQLQPTYLSRLCKQLGLA
jgi:DNA-binding NtrC family response regulator